MEVHNYSSACMDRVLRDDINFFPSNHLNVTKFHSVWKFLHSSNGRYCQGLSMFCKNSVLFCSRSQSCIHSGPQFPTNISYRIVQWVTKLIIGTCCERKNWTNVRNATVGVTPTIQFIWIWNFHLHLCIRILETSWHVKVLTQDRDDQNYMFLWSIARKECSP